MPIQVFNLHQVPVHDLADGEGVLLIETPLCVLERDDAINDAVVCHKRVTENSFDIIDDFALVVKLFVQIEKLLALERLHDLRLLDCERLLLIR